MNTGLFFKGNYSLAKFRELVNALMEAKGESEVSFYEKVDPDTRALRLANVVSNKTLYFAYDIMDVDQLQYALRNMKLHEVYCHTSITLGELDMIVIPPLFHIGDRDNILSKIFTFW